MVIDPHSFIPCGIPAVYIITPLYLFLATLVVVPLVRWVALRAGFVDNPGGRKQHDLPVPPVGGFAIFFVYMIFLLLAGSIASSLFSALGLILVVGIIDDARGMNAKLKFVLHFLAAIILVVGGGAQIMTLGNVLGFGTLELGVMSIPFSVACVVYILNAVNMMDGVDGLAGGNSFIIFGWFAAAALLAGRCADLMQILALMAVLAGFIIYNMRTPFRKRATIFLGDAGSMALGLMVSWFAIRLSQGQGAALQPISVAWIIALPIVDAFGLLLARLKDRKPPFEADTRHFHHHFIQAGYQLKYITPLILFWSGSLGAIGYVGAKQGIPEYVLGWGWIILWWGHALLVIKKDIFIRFLQRALKVCG